MHVLQTYRAQYLHVSVKQTTADMQAWTYKPDFEDAFMYFVLYFYAVCRNVAKTNPLAWQL